MLLGLFAGGVLRGDFTAMRRLGLFACAGVALLATGWLLGVLGTNSIAAYLIAHLFCRGR